MSDGHPLTVPTEAPSPAPDNATGSLPSGDALPPDPEAYDTERNAHARARGLAAPYIQGGRDPEPATGRNEDRFYGRLLLIMVALIVLGGFAFGIVARLLGLTGLVGN